MGISTALVVGLPTDVIPNPWFTRMIPTRLQDYVFLSAITILAGLLGATYAFPRRCSFQEGKWAGGGVLSFLAVGCPICNKIILVLIGTSGALTFFEPIQPFLGIAAISLMGLALSIRLRSLGMLPFFSARAWIA